MSAIPCDNENKKYSSPSANGADLPDRKKTVDRVVLVLFGAGVLGMLLPGMNAGSHQLRSLAEISIAGHMMVFFLGAYLVYAFAPRLSSHSFLFQALVLLSAALGAGFLIEGLQTLIPGRTPSATDIAANIAGVMVFLSLKNFRSISKQLLFHMTTVFITAFLLQPLFKAVADELVAYRQFPLLAGFETPFEAGRFIRGTGRFDVSDDYAFYGKNSLRVRMGTQTYSGIAMEYMPGNWRGHTQLQFAVYNPQEKKLTLHTRIHDTQHAKSGRMIYADRFNRTFSLLPGEWTLIMIPLAQIKNAPKTRKMDMGQITNLGFFVAREAEPVTLYIDDIRLK